MKKLFFFLFGSAICIPVLAQVKGRVIEIGSDKKQSGLPFVIIQVKGGEFTASDSLGYFSLNTPKPGDTLIFTLTGYKPESVLLKKTDKPITVTMNSGVNLNEVEIEYRSTGTDMSYLNPIKTEILNERSLMKAACCNLSESFETNPSIDVTFADAVSGTKQIQMLGLAGQYAQITKENMPYLRGLASSYGMTFIPGTWIQSIQLSKGAGSVVNGYESFTGQINTELQNPEKSDKLHFNTYVNQNQRNEYNLNLSQKFNESFSAGLLSHVSFNPALEDRNKDGFADIPTGKQYNFTNKYAVSTRKGFEAQFGGSYLKDERTGGQFRKFMSNHEDTMKHYAIGINNEKWDVYSKTGFVFKKQGTSMGLQLSYSDHKISNVYGSSVHTGTQNIFYANYIFQGLLGNSNHTYKIGASFLNDKLNESFRLFKFNRDEQATGVFGEYALNYKGKLNVVAGLRGDYHNYYGFFATPRLHVRYGINDNKTVFRLSAGRALKTANIFAENSYLMASSRDWELIVSDLSMPYGLKPEIAWNYGFNFTQKFKLNYRDAHITVDAYRTDFESQVVIDMDYSARKLMIYNLNGKSYSNTIQTEFAWEVRKRLDMKIAYRYVDNKVQYINGMLDKPFLSKHRGFINLSYETKDSHWQFDFTTQYIGAKRISNTKDNPVEYQLPEMSPWHTHLLGQITYLTKFKKSELHVYLGGENLGNFRQLSPIVAVNDPFGKYFDSGMVWGPIYGRMIYAGLRFKIK